MASTPSRLRTALATSTPRLLLLSLAAAALLSACASEVAPEGISVSIFPTSVTLHPNDTQQFQAGVSGTQRTAVTWTVEPASCGAVSTSGLFTAPAAPASCAVRATAQVDTSKSAAAAVTVVAPDTAPVIATFTAAPATIAQGATSTLAWSVTGAASLAIDQGVGAVTGTSTAVQPAATTTYKLTATNAIGSTSKSVTVTVIPPPPAISAFTATPPTIAGGATSTLAWSVSGATSLAIDQAVGDVTSATSTVVQPAKTTTYMLTATNASWILSTYVTVTVSNFSAAPTISAFTATPPSIAPGGSSVLAWSVSGATSISIDQSIGDVTSATSTTVTPAASTTYILTATNGSATSTAQVTVTVAGPKPVISSFSAAPASITTGQSSTLSWTGTGATSLSIDQGVGTVTGTSKAVSPTATTAYTLTATNANGSVTASTTVTVGAAPGITSFTVTPPQITAGQSATLSWTVTGSGTLSIDQGVGAVSGSSTTVAPSTSTTYLLSDTPAGGGTAVVMPVTLTVNPAGPAPFVEEFSVESGGIDAGNPQALIRFPSVTIKSGQSAKLHFAVSGGSGWQITGPSYSQGVSGTSGTVTLASPVTAGTYTLARSGSTSATVTINVNAGTFLPATAPAGTDVTVTIDTGASVHPISPFIYGYNAATLSGAPANATMLRQGGNRYTAWNWENNFSNAGSDYGPYHNDDYLTNSTTPGAAVKPTLDSCQSTSGTGCASLITLPMQGWVSQLKTGYATTSGPYSDYFFPSSPRKGTALSLSPSTSDSVVYQDELAHWLDSNAPQSHADSARPLFLSLDNEPDLWASTHAEIQRSPLTYADLIARSIALTAATKDTVPGALTFGPVSYGWAGYLNLQSAPDASGRDFLDTYMAQLKTASEAQGRRLLDVLDLHYYSEAIGGGARINDGGKPSTTAAAARVQASRSMWESTYVESSWITGCCVSVPSGDEQPGTSPAGIDLVPRMMAKIAARYPGTKLAFTEYDQGGGDHISGAVAQADVLGIFGRTGVYAASQWPEGNPGNTQKYIFGAFNLLRNYDGAGGKFGDTSVSATSSDWSKISVHASVNSGSGGPDYSKVYVLILNRDTVAHTVGLVLNNVQTAILTSYDYYQVAEPVQTSGSAVVPKVYPAGSQSILSSNAANLAVCSAGATGCSSGNSTGVPPMSATLLVLH
jgi:Glycoside hydrolase family 44